MFSDVEIIIVNEKGLGNSCEGRWVEEREGRERGGQKGERWAEGHEERERWVEVREGGEVGISA